MSSRQVTWRAALRSLLVQTLVWENALQSMCSRNELPPTRKDSVSRWKETECLPGCWVRWICLWRPGQAQTKVTWTRHQSDYWWAPSQCWRAPAPLEDCRGWADVGRKDEEGSGERQWRDSPRADQPFTLTWRFALILPTWTGINFLVTHRNTYINTQIYRSLPFMNKQGWMLLSSSVTKW